MTHCAFRIALVMAALSTAPLLCGCAESRVPASWASRADFSAPAVEWDARLYLQVCVRNGLRPTFPRLHATLGKFGDTPAVRRVGTTTAGQPVFESRMLYAARFLNAVVQVEDGRQDEFEAPDRLPIDLRDDWAPWLAPRFSIPDLVIAYPLWAHAGSLEVPTPDDAPRVRFRLVRDADLPAWEASREPAARNLAPC